MLILSSTNLFTDYQVTTGGNLVIVGEFYHIIIKVAVAVI